MFIDCASIKRLYEGVAVTKVGSGVGGDVFVAVFLGNGVLVAVFLGGGVFKASFSGVAVASVSSNDWAFT